MGNTIPIGVGYSLASALNLDREPCVIYIGDAATEEGVFYESANIASLFETPTIFACENNQYSVYTPYTQRRHKDITLSNIARSLGLRTINISSAEPISAINSLQEYLNENIKEPIFIEMETFRYLEHCGPNNDDSLKYRPVEYLEYWKNSDYLNKLQIKLLIEDKEYTAVYQNAYEEAANIYNKAIESDEYCNLSSNL